MRPLTLAIPGEYWDSQIYWGRLYLFERSGLVRVLNWDAVIDGLGQDPSRTLPLECGFRRSNYLYSPEVQLLFRDPAFQQLTLRRFEEVADTTIEVGSRRLDRWTISLEQNRFPFPSSDTCIYWGNVYSASDRGVYRARLGRGNDPSIAWLEQDAQRKWDGLALRLAASYSTLAVAAGADGVVEIDLAEDHSDSFGATNDARSATVHSNTDCVRCDWMYASIYCSSYSNTGGLLDYEFEVEDSQDRRRVRKFDQFLPEEMLFGSVGYSWGLHNRVCQASSHGVKFLRYRAFAKNRDADRLVNTIAFVQVPGEYTSTARHPDGFGGGVVDGSVAVFGTVVEYDDSLVVLATDGSVFHNAGAPVNWRVFPRSTFYSNQLHLILEDHILVLSFNHDVFVDQRTKVVGVRPMPIRHAAGASFS